MKVSAELIRVLFILPGHIQEPEARLYSKLIAFSEFSEGVLVSTGEQPQEHRFGKFEVKLVNYRSNRRFFDTIGHFVACYRAARQLQDTRGLDIVVCYDPLKSGLFGYVIKRLSGCKLLIEVNGVYRSQNLYRLNRRSSILKRRIYPRVQKWVLRRCDAVKCLFEGQIDDSFIPADSPRYTFFDYTSISPRPFESPNTKLVLSVGFPAHTKGMDLLIRAFRSIADDCPGWKLLIIGHFEEEERTSMSELIGKDKRIDLQQAIPFSEIPAIIDSCEIYVQASRTEAMGRALVEAMARGTPRIGSRIDGIPTVINDGKDGLLFESGNCEDLASKLKKLIDDSELRRQMGNEAYERFLGEFTLDRYTELCLNMFREVTDFERHN